MMLIHNETLEFNPRCSMWGKTSGEKEYLSPAGRTRHVGQMMSAKGCLTLLQEHEAVHGLRFNYVSRQSSFGVHSQTCVH